jgi:cell division protein FtsW (lipid II flippase)
LGVGIVLKNPDLGTSTIILSGIFSVFFILRARWSDLLIIISLISPILILFYLINPHAQERINTFVSPDKNSEHQNYQVLQTKISLGAGGLWGDGFAQGVQKYHHLPEPVGDSIFAVLGEEFGFFGVLIILILILTLCFRLIYISLLVRDPFGKAILIGTGVVILTQTFLNAGSASAAIPFTGVPLPLISHGSTSIIITMAMLGICSQISAKKFIL